ncbi:TIGR04104 family putative zinc finger protein [Alkalihalobacillus sp. R86527]|uniref:TIGR04104 family putative zinc finger protein n=1 Tax=Alkalihalobacillus sp. R86527 TaxID=3093863 RepID=UPI00366F0100
MNGCPKCHFILSRWYLFKRTLIKKEYPITCPKCSQPLYFTAKSLRMTFALIPILPILLIVVTMLDVSEIISGLIIFMLLLTLLTAYPFILELTVKEEELF